MSSTKTTAPAPRLTQRDEDTLKRIAAKERPFDLFSAEQRIQVRRLTRCLEAETGKPHDTDAVIATLAAAALFVFGLDPIARDAYDVVSSAVFDGDDGDLINTLINEPAQSGEKWTAQQRRFEREHQAEATS